MIILIFDISQSPIIKNITWTISSYYIEDGNVILLCIRFESTMREKNCPHLPWGAR